MRFFGDCVYFIVSLTETVVKTLVDAYGLQPITAPQQDLDAILHRV